MSLSEIQKERNEQCRERHELAVNRIRSMVTEETVEKAYVGYFQDVALFLLELENTRWKVASGEWENYTLEQMRSLNEILYSDILDKNYERSYANPEYAVSSFGTEMGQLLSLLYAELRGGIPYAFEEKTDYLTILYELFIEVYNCFENAALEEASEQSTADEKESRAAGAEKQIPSAEQIRGDLLDDPVGQQNKEHTHNRLNEARRRADRIAGFLQGTIDVGVEDIRRCVQRRGISRDNIEKVEVAADERARIHDGEDADQRDKVRQGNVEHFLEASCAVNLRRFVERRVNAHQGCKVHHGAHADALPDIHDGQDERPVF